MRYLLIADKSYFINKFQLPTFMKKKSDQTKILLAGDACQDNYLFTYAEKDHKSITEIRPNWQFSRSTSLYKKPGGVLLISHFLNGLGHTIIHQGNSKKTSN